MNEYKAEGVVTIHGGRVLLNEDQAKRRAHAIQPKKKNQKKGVYKVIAPIQFKIGEEFGYDGEIPKTIAKLLTDLDYAKAADEAHKELIDTIIETIEQLEDGNEEHWSEDGVPNINVIQDVMGRELTEANINEAMSLVKDSGEDGEKGGLWSRLFGNKE